MLGLFIDTVSPTNLVFLFAGRKALARKKWVARRNEAEKLLPAIQTVLRQGHTSLQKMKAIAVVTGPGRFTSTRVGILAANALAHLLDIPVTGIDRLELLAWQKLTAVSKKQQPAARKIFPMRIFLPSGQGDFFTATYASLPGVSRIRLVKTAPVTHRAEPAAPEEALREKAFLAFWASPKKISRRSVDPVYVRQAHITRRKKR